MASSDMPRISERRARTVRQRTLKSAIKCRGIALHSGAKVSMSLIPADPGTGIVFRRTDLSAAGVEVPALWDNVADTTMCTVLGGNGASVGTVEHLMAALAACGIDNLHIDIDGPEVPVMDGSAAPFMFLIECAGIAEQAAPRRAIRVERTVVVEDEGRMAALVPGSGFAARFDIAFDSDAIGRQTISRGISQRVFKAEFARARTFGFLNEVEYLRSKGLAQGGSLDNAVVISNDQVLNEEGLRYEDEFVRHKVLDAVGDLYLAGAPIIGHFHGVCSGHAMNNRLLATLLADAGAWSWVDMAPSDLAPAEQVADLAPTPARKSA